MRRNRKAGVPLFDVTDEKTWNETFGGDGPASDAMCFPESIEKRGAAIQAFVNAMVKGSDWVKANTPEAIVDLIYQDYLSGFPKEAALRASASTRATWVTQMSLIRQLMTGWYGSWVTAASSATKN